MISIIIPSRTDQYLNDLLASIFSTQPNWRTYASILIADDGLSPDFKRSWEPLGIVFLPTEKPFCFARNVNQSIQASSDGSDILLLNDDVVIQTNGFLEKTMLLSRGFGAVSYSITHPSGVGNSLQVHCPNRCSSPISEPTEIPTGTLCFVAVLLRREALNSVGLLDERYRDYGYEDDDWCIRARAKGVRLGVTHHIVASHGKGGFPCSSTFHRIHGGGFHVLSIKNQVRFEDKWRGKNDLSK
jgi:hypothetical protein